MKTNKKVQEEDPYKIVKHMFTMFIETKKDYDKHLFYKKWLTDYFIDYFNKI